MQSNKYTQYVRLCFLRGDIRASKFPVIEQRNDELSCTSAVWLEAITKLNQAVT